MNNFQAIENYIAAEMQRKRIPGRFEASLSLQPHESAPLAAS